MTRLLLAAALAGAALGCMDHDHHVEYGRPTPIGVIVGKPVTRPTHLVAELTPSHRRVRVRVLAGRLCTSTLAYEVPRHDVDEVTAGSARFVSAGALLLAAVAFAAQDSLLGAVITGTGAAVVTAAPLAAERTVVTEQRARPRTMPGPAVSCAEHPLPEVHVVVHSGERSLSADTDRHGRARFPAFDLRQFALFVDDVAVADVRFMPAQP